MGFNKYLHTINYKEFQRINAFKLLAWSIDASEYYYLREKTRNRFKEVIKSGNTENHS